MDEPRTGHLVRLFSPVPLIYLSLKRFASVLLLVGFGLGLAGLFLEVGVRLFLPVSDFFWQSDPILGVKLVANKRGRFVKPGLFDVHVETNSHGFRDREHAYEKPAGTKRVVILGDSYMEALQVPLERSLTALLEKRLRDRKVPAETINLGVSAYGTGREYLMLREHGIKHKPDLVLLFFVGNDLINNNIHLEGTPYVPYPVLDGNGLLARNGNGEPRFTPIHDTESRFGFLTGFLREYSSAYRLLRMTIEGSPQLHELLYRFGIMSTPAGGGKGTGDNLGLYEIYRVAEQDAFKESWRLTENLLLEVDRLAAKNGAKLVVVLVPAPWEVYPELWESIRDQVPEMRRVALDVNQPSRHLISFLQSRKIPHIDLLAGFRANAGKAAKLFFQPDSHWTAAGHDLAADLLADPVSTLLEQR
jgi:lysophospholipase L1-like esterase